MTASTFARIVLALLAPLLIAAARPVARPVTAPAALDAPQFTFHRQGEVGVFRVEVPRAWAADDAPARLTSPDGAAYLIFREGRILEADDDDEDTPPKPSTRGAAFLGRFQGSGSHELRLVVLPPGTSDLGPRTSDALPSPRPFTVTLPEADVESPELPARWALAGIGRLVASGRDTFGSFVQWSWASRFLGGNGRFWTPPGAQREAPDLLSVSTGLYAAQESLQLEALARTDPVETAASTVPVKSLRGPDIKSHPFKAMLKGRRAEVDDLAAWVPADRWYLRVRGVPRLLDLTRTVDQWVTLFVRNLAESSHDARVLPRTLLQLGLSQDALRRPEFAAAIHDVALLGPDPFFVEGTSVCAVFAPADATALGRTLDEAWADTAKSSGALPTEIAGKPLLRGLVAPDRTVNAWRFDADGRIVLCNSLALAREVLATRAAPGRSLAKADDFAYLRSVLPADDGEDAFLFLSDAHIRNLVGPRWKLAEQRRIRCAAMLQTESHAADLFRIERRRAPASLDEMVNAGLLTPTVTICPDGGKHSLDAATQTAKCSLHGRLGALVPVGELPLERVTKEEQSVYERFVSEYQQYWRQYFDPIGVRVGLRDGVTVDTVILPLVENSVYNLLKELTGGGTVPASTLLIPSKTLFHAQAALGPELMEKGLRILHDVQRHARLPQVDPGRVFGPDVTFGLYDRELLFDFDVYQFFGTELSQRWGVDGFLMLPVLAALNLPTYVTLGLRDPAAFQRLLDGLLTMARALEDQQDESARMNQWFSFDAYDLPEYGGHPVHALGIKLLGLLKWRLFFTVLGDRLVVASKEFVLRDLVDLFAARPAAPPTGTTNSPTASLRFLLDRRAFDRILADVHLSWAEHARRACLGNLPAVEAAVLASGTGTLDDARHWSLSRRGHAFFCPDLGEYRLDPDTGRVSCSLHGDRWTPRQSQVPNALPKSAAFLEKLGPATVDLSFTPEGLKTHVRLEMTK